MLMENTLMEKFSLMEKKSSLFSVGGNEMQFFFFWV